jgi:Raf kinase inhibitor-like YbhB/YbcL family protein
MKLTSTSYQDKGTMPEKYATTAVTGGKNLSPQFSWSEAPAGTKSYVLVNIDVHPIASGWVHWIVINIPATTCSLDENCSNSPGLPAGAKELDNSYGRKGYGGPQPPKGSGKHEYVTTLYALDIEKLNLSGEYSEKGLLKEIGPHILGRAVHTGYFSR